MSYVPNDQTLPVIRITIVLNAKLVRDELRPRYVIRDNGGDFKTDELVLGLDGDTREELRREVDDTARERMQHYCSLGYAVEAWSIPS